MRIHTLTIIKETHDECAYVVTRLYEKPEDAIEAYNKAFDEAKIEAESYSEAREDDEVATDTPYRWWSIYDEDDCYDRITIELDTKEVL